MIRVLFVDDDAAILSGLRRTLRLEAGSLRVAFANDGEEALDLMSEDPFDVIVSDMRMPGMDGAELLDSVRRLHPSVVRIALSGQAEDRAVLRAVNPCHQFLAKPCEVELLKRTLDRIDGLRQALDDQRMASIVTGTDTLPTLPELYQRVTARLREETPTVADLSAAIADDPAMSAKLLKVANAGYFGFARRTASIERAVGYLGVETVRSLVLSTGIFRPCRDPERRGTLTRLWRHGRRAGIAARAIARYEGLDADSCDAAYMAGLLHDIGRLALLAPASSDGASEESGARTDGPKWKTPLAAGTALAEVGAFLLGLWCLPDEVVDAVAGHLRPGEDEQGALAAIVHAAVRLTAGDETAPDGARAEVGWDAVARSGFGDRASEWSRAAREAVEAEGVEQESEPGPGEGSLVPRIEGEG